MIDSPNATRKQQTCPTVHNKDSANRLKGANKEFLAGGESPSSVKISNKSLGGVAKKLRNADGAGKKVPAVMTLPAYLVVFTG